MWISPSYAAEYRDWLAKGLFTEIHLREAAELQSSLKNEHPAMIATSLDGFATCYYTRGVVSIMEGRTAGWSDLQCGYWAMLYSLFFEIKAITLPAWSQGRKFTPRKMIELVLTSGLARLYRQEGDLIRLRECIDIHFSWDQALGPKTDAGRKILESILDPDKEFTRQELLQDRKDCCNNRDAWPTRPTEVVPFGVLDVEIALRFPGGAAFKFSGDFKPTNDDQITQAIVTYHNSFE
jgi:hypothetical protein